MNRVGNYSIRSLSPSEKTYGWCFHSQDAELAKARSEKDSRRQQKEQMTDEKEKLVAHINLLKRFLLHSIFHACRLLHAHKTAILQYTDKLFYFFFVLQWSQFADLKLRLQKQKDELSAANERMAERLEKLIAENGDLTISNATLKVERVTFLLFFKV